MTTTTTLTNTLAKVYNKNQDAVPYLPNDELSVALKNRDGVKFSSLQIPTTRILYYKNGKRINNNFIKTKCSKLSDMCYEIREDEEEKVFDIQVYMKIINKEIYILDIQIEGDSLDYREIIKYSRKYGFKNLPIIGTGTYQELVELNKNCIIYSVNPIYCKFDKRYICRYTIEKSIPLIKLSLDYNTDSDEKI